MEEVVVGPVAAEGNNNNNLKCQWISNSTILVKKGHIFLPVADLKEAKWQIVELIVVDYYYFLGNKCNIHLRHPIRYHQIRLLQIRRFHQIEPNNLGQTIREGIEKEKATFLELELSFVKSVAHFLAFTDQNYDKRMGKEKNGLV